MVWIAYLVVSLKKLLFINISSKVFGKERNIGKFAGMWLNIYKTICVNLCYLQFDGLMAAHISIVPKINNQVFKSKLPLAIFC